MEELNTSFDERGIIKPGILTVYGLNSLSAFLMTNLLILVYGDEITAKQMLRDMMSPQGDDIRMSNYCSLECTSYPGAQRMAYESHISRNSSPIFLVQYALYCARLSDQILTPGMFFTVCMTTYFSSSTKSLWRLAQIAEEVLFELTTF